MSIMAGGMGEATVAGFPPIGVMRAVYRIASVR